MHCEHTNVKWDEKGSQCIDCDEKILEVEIRECQFCTHSVHLLTGWICRQHLMSISPKMHVTYSVSFGTCWVEK